MRKIKIYSVGKTRENWLLDALSEYTKRLKPHFQIEWHLFKNELGPIPEKSYIALDPEGQAVDSPSFAKLLEKSSLTFVIGGDKGLTDEMKGRATKLISLSPLTFTHQMTRLILLEQVYRGVQINLGTPYHK